MIIEAKKEGIYFELPAGFSELEYSLSSLCRDNPQVAKAIKQTLEYCQSSGTMLGAVCNGYQLIAFIASRDDGILSIEGRAIVFDSLDKMFNKFLDLWQCLSKPGVQTRELQTRLLGTARPQIPGKLSAKIIDYPGYKARNILQADLQVVSELVIEDVATVREVETDFIKECFCSSGALSQYALVNKSILEHRYAALFNSGSQSLTLTPAMTKKGISREIIGEGLSKRPIILLGDVGVGKTMFVRYLLKVGAPEVIKNTIVFYIDLGSKAALVSDLRDFFMNEMENQLFNNDDVDIKERNFVHGIYNIDLVRFSRGVHADLKESKPELYREKEVEFLEEKIRRQEEHLKASLKHISKGRKKQLIIILDNADQREESIQQQAFMVAQELAGSWPVAVYIAIRPRTFHKSKQFGTLSGYHPRAFTISPPRVDDVILKRLLFALKISRGEIALSCAPGLSIKLEKLSKYLDVLIYSFQNNRELIEFIDNICSGNIRLALELVTSFISSGHVDTQKILNIVEKTDKYLVPLHEFLRAVIFGDNEHYDPEASPIANLFDLKTPDPREHFLLPILIEYIHRAASFAGSQGFVEGKLVYRFAQDNGFTQEQVESTLNTAIRKRLIEAEARVHTADKEKPPHLRATTVGIYHIKKLVALFTYIDAVVVDTPILDSTLRGRIRNEHYIRDRLDRAEMFLDYLNDKWKLIDESTIGFKWSDSAEELRQDIEGIRGRARA